MIPQLSEALRFLFHVKPDPPGFRPSSTQEDAMDFNLNCRRRKGPGPLGRFGGFSMFQHVSAANMCYGCLFHAADPMTSTH